MLALVLLLGARLGEGADGGAKGAKGEKASVSAAQAERLLASVKDVPLDKELAASLVHIACASGLRREATATLARMCDARDLPVGVALLTPLIDACRCGGEGGVADGVDAFDDLSRYMQLYGHTSLLLRWSPSLYGNRDFPW